jgi:hypothetical protein
VEFVKPGRSRFVRFLYFVGAVFWALFAVIALVLIFPQTEPQIVQWHPLFQPLLDFRFSVGSFFVELIRPFAFLAASLVCLGVSAWLYVLGTVLLGTVRE